MDQISVRCWEEFEPEVNGLRGCHPGATFLFRGLSNSAWSLSTTLERTIPGETAFTDYHRLIAASEPQIRTLIGKSWDDIESCAEIEALTQEYDKFDLYLWGGRLRALGYMAYLRHHGFPSPLLELEAIATRRLLLERRDWVSTVGG